LSINKELILLYHHIGTEILKAQKQQGWGAKVIDQLSHDLRAEFAEMKGFSTRNLKYMRKFAEEYPDAEFVQQLVAQLPWGRTVVLLDKITVKEDRLFYIKQVIEQSWSRNHMVRQIEQELHKRQGKAITNCKTKLLSNLEVIWDYTYCLI
jgi:predicted nuclease of restriction endonuclease-like (RecB) superfamily